MLPQPTDKPQTTLLATSAGAAAPLSLSLCCAAMCCFAGRCEESPEQQRPALHPKDAGTAGTTQNGPKPPGGGGGKAAEHLKGLHRAVWVRASRRPLPLKRRRGTTLSHHLRLLLLVGGEVAVALPPLAAPPPARRHLRPDRPRHLGAVVEGERPWPVFSMSPADLRLRELQCKPNGNRRRPRRNTHSPQHGAAGAAGGRTHGPMAGSPAPDRFA